mmetsp:Transcript_42204/g.116482  ORF Transcript_42204/g.116482 Transcript_42204/m.116482 type:complete len:247 (+) Transcript_42204:1364-2104(+)
MCPRSSGVRRHRFRGMVHADHGPDNVGGQLFEVLRRDAQLYRQVPALDSEDDHRRCAGGLRRESPRRAPGLPYHRPALQRAPRSRRQDAENLVPLADVPCSDGQQLPARPRGVQGRRPQREHPQNFACHRTGAGWAEGCAAAAGERRPRHAASSASLAIDLYRLDASRGRAASAASRRWETEGHVHQDFGGALVLDADMHWHSAFWQSHQRRPWQGTQQGKCQLVPLRLSPGARRRDSAGAGPFCR